MSGLLGAHDPLLGQGALPALPGRAAGDESLMGFGIAATAVPSAVLTPPR